MKILKRIISSVLAVSLILPVFTNFVHAENEQITKSISNDYMEFSVNDDTGFFSIHTKEGHPQKSSDNNMSLLYDGESIETSFTTVRIDDKDYIFGQDYGLFGMTSQRVTSTVDVVNNIISTEWTIKDIKITQKAQLSRTDNTANTGNVKLSYEVDNQSDKNHSIGIRVMLDNALGEIDAPVTMVQREISPLSKETEFFSNNRDAGSYVRYLDNYEVPTKEAFITFNGISNPNPDKMIIGHWYHLASTKWDYKPDTDFSFDTGFNSFGTADTATALYWNASDCAPGAKINKTVIYGVGEFTEGYTNSNFNISLDLEGSLELDDKGNYKNDIITANINVYNNVDGSVDLENARLSLACDNGLKFLIGSEDSDEVFEGTDFVKELGFIKAGTMETYTIQLRADVPQELKALKVSVSVKGNSDTNIVSASKYVVAPSKKDDKASMSIEAIEANAYHIAGKRVMKAFGKFSKELLTDETKWKAAFVNKDYPEIRYDIDSINIISDTEMTIVHNGDMIEGTYNIEFAFFDDYKEMIADKYVSGASISIVNDSRLMTDEYDMVCVYRTGTGLASNYSLIAMRSEQELAAMQQKIAQANKTANASVAELPLIFRGMFTPERDANENITGYVATDDFTVNGIVFGQKDSAIEYVNYRNDGEAVWDGIIVKGKGNARSKEGIMINCDWKIEIENNVLYSLGTGNIRLQADGVASYLIDMVGGFVNMKFGVFSRSAEYGDCISFGGTFMLSGYTADAPAPNPNDVDQKNGVRKFDTPESLKVNKLNIYASAEITDIMFNKDGFVGINTTLEIGIAASNILRTARKDTYMLKLHIDTINGSYGGKITFSSKGCTVSMELAFLLKEDKDGNTVFTLDDIGLNLMIPPTKPLDIVSPYVALVQGGLAMRGLASATDILETPTSQEMVEAVSSSTFEIDLTVGLLILRALVGTGNLKLGLNHLTITVTATSPAVPSVSTTVYVNLQFKYPVSDEAGNEVSPFKCTLVLSLKMNAFNIVAVSGTFSYSHTDSITVNDTTKEGNDYVGLTVYGTVSIPPLVPIIGGMEVFGLTGTIDTIGVKGVAEIMGCEFGVTYAWEDEDVVWIYSDDETGSKIGITNMQYLPVEIVTDDSASLFSADAGTSISANIITNSGSNNLIAVKYNGTTPDIKELSLDIDGNDYPLKAATKESGYSDGNCIIMPDNGEGGKIIIGVNDNFDGKRNYTLTAKNAGIRMSAVEGGAFKKNVKVQSATVNPDGTVTVKADKSLKNSNVQVLYTNSKDTYDNVITESYIDEDGKKQVNVYKMVNGQKVKFDEKLMENVVEYSVYNEAITEDTDEITITPQIGPEAESGNYYVMAVVSSPYNKISRAYADTSVSYKNENEPICVANAELADIGDEKLEVNITDDDNADYEGYFVSLYNETDGEYEYRDEYFKKGESITYSAKSGSTYHAEVETVRTYGDNQMAYSADKRTNSVTVHTPERVNASIALTNETYSGNYPNMNGTIRQVDYISGRIASFTAHADEAVRGGFVVDGMETSLTEEKQQDFTYSGEFDEGVHTVAFKAVNDKGDSKVTDSVTFAVKEKEPSIMLENSIVKVTDGKITLKGYCQDTEKLSFMGKQYTPNADGSFEITENIATERFAQRYELSATGYSGLQSTTSVIVINGEFKPVDRVEILADGQSVDSITVEPGKTVQLSAIGYCGDEQRNIDDIVDLSVVHGNNIAAVDDNNQLKVLSSGTAYVKTVYNLGSYITADMISSHKLEDMIEINVKRKASDVTASIPDGASVKKGTKLTLSADGDIYYTTDGTEPTRNSTLYTEPISLTKDVTIKAVCFKENCIDGDVMTVSYKVKQSSSSSSSSGDAAKPQTPTENNAVITATASDKKVEYGYPVTLDANGAGKIYYTTDGTTPNKNSMEYTKPITLTDDTVIKAVVWQEGDVYSQVYTFNYELDGYMIKLRDDMEKSMLINGYEDGTFRPDSSITRAETASLLRRSSEMYGYYINDDVFSDVEMWAKKDINELAAAGAISGYGDGTFRPDNAVTRAEFVAMLMRIIGETGSSSAFEDAKGHWAEKYIDKASEYGYINGYEDGTFRPDNNITRAEVVTIMSKVFGFAPDGASSRFVDVTNSHWAFGYVAD